MADEEALKQKVNICNICSVSCSSAFQLCEHVIGHKHRMNVKRVSPGSLPYVYKLQYFFDTYMKLDPLVGLEYVEETQVGSRYRYKCLLCGFHGDRKPAFLHITGPDHITKYLEKHHPKLYLHAARYSPKNEYLKALQQVTVKVCKLYGRKKLKEINDDDGPTPQKMSKCSSKPKTVTAPDINEDFHTKSLRFLERKGDQCPRELPGFKGNGDFLDYLQKFEIRNDEDAWIIKQITQNCTQALVKFREEQAQRNEPWGEVPGGPPASDDAPMADKSSSVLDFGGNSAKVALCHASVPPTDATELFFNSIKNMEESEVGDILHNIAATNPAFRGIDIPNVIKYLQATGRLKTS